MGNKRVTVFTFGVALLLLSACERYDSHGQPKGFFSKPYSDFYCEFKRIPLVFPYEINDFHGDTQLTRWDYLHGQPMAEIKPDMILHILRFSQTNGHVFGECDRGWVYPSGELRYFVFSLSTTNLLFCSNKVEFAQQCATFGGDVRQMRPFEEQWKTYWEQHDKREKQSEKKRP
jgi:hypothetical protein